MQEVRLVHRLVGRPSLVGVLRVSRVDHLLMRCRGHLLMVEGVHRLRRLLRVPREAGVVGISDLLRRSAVVLLVLVVGWPALVLLVGVVELLGQVNLRGQGSLVRVQEVALGVSPLGVVRPVRLLVEHRGARQVSLLLLHRRGKRVHQQGLHLQRHAGRDVAVRARRGRVPHGRRPQRRRPPPLLPPRPPKVPRGLREPPRRPKRALLHLKLLLLPLLPPP